MNESIHNISLYLMTEKGFQTLNHLIQKSLHVHIQQVIIGRDKNVLRDYSEEIQTLCQNFNINFHFKGDKTIQNTDISIAISWRWLIDIDKKSKLIVLHDSILPKYRGFAPLVNMLINGEKEIGVTAIFASEKYDEGEVLDQKTTFIEYPIKINDAISIICSLYTEIVESLILKYISNDGLISVPQNEIEKSYSLWRDDSDYQINWNHDSEYIKRFIDAVSFPYLGASTYISDQKVRIFDAEIVEDVQIENRHPGKVIFIEHSFPIVVCGRGLLKITDLRDDLDNNILPLKQFRIKFS